MSKNYFEKTLDYAFFQGRVQMITRLAARRVYTFDETINQLNAAISELERMQYEDTRPGSHVTNANSLLDRLGRLLWYRCRCCGIEFNREAKTND